LGFWAGGEILGGPRWQRDGAERENGDRGADPGLGGYPKAQGGYPTYRVVFPQTPAAPPPVAQPAQANASLRDASIVGAQLAKRRPVNVVRFTHGPGEEKTESAAVVFVFHGRYCIYSPEMGTVPFRVRGDVANLRLIQDLLRRAFPGAGNVRKL